jgi:S-adenosylmethionine:tRNA-ribosyltransferase-isomerase (queuine synthetase)
MVGCVQVDDHKMHSEFVELTQETIDLIIKTKLDGKRVVAIGWL